MTMDPGSGEETPLLYRPIEEGGEDTTPIEESNHLHAKNVRKHLDINLKKWSVYATRRILDPAIPMIVKECSIILNNKGRPPTRRGAFDWSA
jgi:hypothetical protein